MLPRFQTMFMLLAMPLGLYAQEPSLLEETKARMKVQAQKLEHDVWQALRDAQQLAAKDSTASLEKLRAALKEVDDDRSLSDGRRTSLQKMLKDRIRVAELVPETPVEPNTNRAGKEISKVERERLDRLFGRLQTTPADPKQAAASTADNRIKSTQQQLEDLRKLREAGGQGTTDVQRQVSRASLPPKGDMEYPANWKELSARRSRSTAQPLTPRERELHQALSQTITMRFKDSRLEDVLEYLQTYLKQPIILNKPTLDQLNLNYDTAISINVHGISVKSALRKMLADLGLTFIVKEGVIEVVTPQQAKTMLTTRVYYVGDLVRFPWEAAQMIELITSTIDPESWAVNGGLGTIVYHPLTSSLVVKQSAEFHYSLSSSR